MMKQTLKPTLTTPLLPSIFLTITMSWLVAGCSGEPVRARGTGGSSLAEGHEARQQISAAIDSGRKRMLEEQRTTDLQHRVSSLQHELGSLQQELDALQHQVEHLCIWEHTELDGSVVTTLLPLDCDEPIRSRSTRVISTAYYSPQQGQDRYATGSLAGDQRLNGKGEWTADGTRPDAGTVAAPPEYAFGTRLYVDGYGSGTVHDRGSAIQRGYGYDRLDLWMGEGQSGLLRSEAWGIRECEAAVFVAGDPDDIARVLEHFVT